MQVALRKVGPDLLQHLAHPRLRHGHNSFDDPMIPRNRRASPGSNGRRRTRDGSGFRMVLERLRGTASAVPFSSTVTFPTGSRFLSPDSIIVSRRSLVQLFDGKAAKIWCPGIHL
jgi:hypothetical protein